MFGKKLMLFYWFPVFGWMTVIFLMSSRQRVSVSEEYIVNFFFFKSLHVIEYGFMFYLIFRLINKISTSKNNFEWRYIIAALLTLIYAASDELHQTFVPTRQGSVRDIFIDLIGVTISWIILRKAYRKLKKYSII